eukprot:SAG31_NODE_348_length_17296_cov_5.089482_11_plen_48_part_00
MIGQRFEGKDLCTAVAQLPGCEIQLDKDSFGVAGIDESLQRGLAHEV